jgi:16S rRNA (cytidine1402-2'-O)-methyltransferase
MIEELLSVALPIGNPEDLSFHARKVFEGVDGVLAEDTRKFKEFVRSAGLKIACDVQGLPAFEEKETDYSSFFKKLKGRRWAFVSDAGTPAVSDPGAWLMKAARVQNIKIRAIPGVSALSMSLQLTGGFGLPVCFLGFAPKKNKEDFFKKAAEAKTIIFFESKHEIVSCLKTLILLHPDSKLYVLREMTKEYEEFMEGTAQELLPIFEKRTAADEPIGELTLVLEGKKNEILSSQSISAEELVEFRSATPTQAAKMLAKFTGESKDKAYERLSKK